MMYTGPGPVPFYDTKEIIMDTITDYAIRAYGRVGDHRFDTEQDARQTAEDIYGVDDPDVSIVRVTTTFEVVS